MTKIMERGIFLRAQSVEDGTDYFFASSDKIYINLPDYQGQVDEVFTFADIDDLNPTASSAFASGIGNLFVYDDYNISFNLVFPGNTARLDRIDFVTTKAKDITTIGVVNDIYNDKNVFYYKPARLVYADLTENKYVNGLLLNVKLEVSGSWNYLDDNKKELHVDFI